MLFIATIWIINQLRRFTILEAVLYSFINTISDWKKIKILIKARIEAKTKINRESFWKIAIKENVNLDKYENPKLE